MALLEIQGLTKKIAKGKQTIAAVDQIDLTVERGESVGLVGESGCGKTTTAHMIARLLKEDDGQIYFRGIDITKPQGIKRQRQYMQMVFQNPTDSFNPRYSLLDSVKQGVRFFANDSEAELEKKAKEAIAYVGLKESYYNLPVHQLSGGECQRAAIARAIIGNPEMIICDEATSALDVSVQAQIVKLLLTMQQEKHMSYLFITHDLALASSMCQRIAVMYKGSIVELGETQAIINNPIHPYTRLLINCVLPTTIDRSYSIPSLDAKREHTETGCKFYQHCPDAVSWCAEQRPTLEAAEGRLVRCHISDD